MSEQSDCKVKIQDAKYLRASTNEITENPEHLDNNQKNKIKELLGKHTPLFDGTLGRWKGSPYSIKLKYDVQPYNSRPYSIPHTYKQTFQSKVQQLC